MNVAKIDNDVLTSDDLVKWLKLSGRFEEAMQDFLTEKLAAAAATRQRIAASTEELQARADQHRRVQGLYRAKEANQFLDEAGVTLDEFEHYITDALLAEKVYEQLTNKAALEKYFNLNSPKFESVEISHIVVDSEGKAKELMSLLKDEPTSFAGLAKEHSLDDETAAEGGRIGKVLRGALDNEIEAKIFNASEGDLVGPIADERGLYHEIFMVNGKRRSTLDDDDTTIAARGLIYDEWLESRRNEHKVEIL